MRRAVLLALLLAAACGGKARTDTAGPGAGQDAPELAVLDRFEQLDDEVEKSRGQCPRLAAGLDGWLEANREPVRALIEQSRAQPGLAGDRLDRVERHLERIFERVLDAVTGCKGQGGVDQAYARLDTWLEQS